LVRHWPTAVAENRRGVLDSLRLSPAATKLLAFFEGRFEMDQHQLVFRPGKLSSCHSVTPWTSGFVHLGECQDETVDVVRRAIVHDVHVFREDRRTLEHGGHPTHDDETHVVANQRVNEPEVAALYLA
jgi:hypothetical protein